MVSFFSVSLAFGAEKTTSTYYPIYGYGLDAAVAKTGNVLVSLGGGSSPPGIQVFDPANGYSNPCEGKVLNEIIDYGPLGMATVDGLVVFPDGNRNLGKNRQGIGAAVEQNGVEFVRANVKNCKLDGQVNVPQEPVTNPPPPRHASPGSFTLAITPDGDFAFVANEYGVADTSQDFNMNQTGTVGVIRVRRDSVGRFKPSTRQVSPIGYIFIPGANTIPGVTVSRDGKYLFVVNEGSAAGIYPHGVRYGGSPYSNPTRLKDPRLATELCVNEYGQSNDVTRNGVLTVIDVEMATSGQGQASIVQTIAAGCSPVRVVETQDGKYVFVASRGGNPASLDSKKPGGSVGRIAVFKVAKLVSPHRDKANSSVVNVFNSGGTQPVGMALFDNDRRLAVANSNRFTTNGSGKTSVAILNVRRPRQVPKQKIVCRSPELTSFPRGVAADGSTVYVANFGKPAPGNTPGALQVIDYVSGKSHGCKSGPYPVMQ